MRPASSLIGFVVVFALFAPMKALLADPDKRIEEVAKLGVHIRVATKVDVEVRQPVEDFFLVQFRLSSGVMRAYIGNHPMVSKALKRKSAKREKVNGLPVLSHARSSEQNHWSAEYLFDLTRLNNFPQYVHFFYEDVPENIRSAFERIIKSTTASKQQQGGPDR